MVDNVRFVPRTETQPLRQPQVSPSGTVEGTSFDAVLRDELAGAGEVRFSAHALKRLDSTGIELSAREKTLIEEGVQRAAGKGARESLVLTDRLALVVSVRNRTVITVRPNDRLDDGVFTNIDSAVICRDGSGGSVPANPAYELL